MFRFLLTALTFAFIYPANLCFALEPFTTKDIFGKIDYSDPEKILIMAPQGDPVIKAAASVINYDRAKILAKKNNTIVSGPECNEAMKLIKEITELKPAETDVEALQAQASAWRILGDMNENNNCVVKNKWKALECYEKAAKIGYIEAMIKTAYAYQHAYDGNTGRYEEAQNWYEKAAAAGSAQAKYLLGNFYEYPQHRNRKDIKKAREWYEFAAKDGYPEAQFRLGMMYQDGESVRQDTGKALSWLEKAASQKHLKAKYEMGMIYYKGEGIDKNINKAKELFGEACDAGYESACGKYAAINKEEH